MLKQSTRQAVFARDGRVCALCGVTDDLAIDHVLPIVRGGTDDLSNLRVLCRSCNTRKAGTDRFGPRVPNAPGTIRSITPRLPKSLLTDVDERASRVGLSRNAWIKAATELALDEGV